LKNQKFREEKFQFFGNKKVQTKPTLRYSGEAGAMPMPMASGSGHPTSQISAASTQGKAATNGGQVDNGDKVFSDISQLSDEEEEEEEEEEEGGGDKIICPRSTFRNKLPKPK
jgi:hypothetical protein